jgi:alpha-galactosidase
MHAKPLTIVSASIVMLLACATIAGAAEPAAKAPAEPKIILTPKPPHQPRINGAKLFGVRPGHPFLFTIPATGDRPMQFSVEGLPDGLQVDASTGTITGAVAQPGEHVVTLVARNALGKARRKFRIVVGPKLMLTPSMGWNSWYCLLMGVTGKDLRAAADAMVSSGMINHGYMYVDVDDGWLRRPAKNGVAPDGPPRDQSGRILPNNRFGDMKALADYIHARGLKAGLYISPGPATCGGCIGSYGHVEQDARTFADWGFDLLKYDWCSYGEVAAKLPGTKLEKFQAPYRAMGAALARQDRDIVLNMCQYGMGDVWKWGAEVGGHSWRSTGDLGMPGDLAGSMYNIGFSQNGHEPWAGPGHWNDPDYLLIGWINWEGKLRPTPLSPNEQYTHVTLWSILAAPLIFSGDMQHLDEFTLSLLCNDEVIEVNQDPLGRQARRIARDGKLEVWAKDMEDGSKAVGLFNRGEKEAPVVVRWKDLGLDGKQTVRDLWRQKDVGQFQDRFEMRVPRHGAALVRLTAVKE